jgi:UDP-GlcNAc3NAcA epimerase
MADVTTILTVIGARPQFIKAATVSRAISGRADMREILVHTGQHYDANMSDTFFEELAIPVPGHNLNIGSGPHGAQTGAMLEAIERVLLQEKPDWLLVYGDTNSTIAGALAAAKLHVPVAHVEAGMRSFNRRMPEELNRVLTDHLSTLNLTSTQTATAHLASEGISGDRVLEVGDVMYDAARFYGGRAGDRSALLDRLDVKSGEFLLATVHRAENTDDPRRMDAIIEAFISLGESHRIVLPLHPRTRAVLEQPLGYLDMVALERDAVLVATDSGGVQKEAFFHGTPCVTLRDETEWVELVEAGWNTIVPPVGAEEIVAGVRSSIGTRGEPIQPYGQGDAAERVVDALMGVIA